MVFWLGSPFGHHSLQRIEYRGMYLRVAAAVELRCVRKLKLLESTSRQILHMSYGLQLEWPRAPRSPSKTVASCYAIAWVRNQRNSTPGKAVCRYQRKRKSAQGTGLSRATQVPRSVAFKYAAKMRPLCAQKKRPDRGSLVHNICVTLK